MRKFSFLCSVYGFVLTVLIGLTGPSESCAEVCNNDKLVANLDIKALKGEDSVLETIRQVYRRLANSVEVPLELLLADDVVWKVEGVSGVVPFAGTYLGKEGVLRYLEDVKQAVCIESLAVRFFVKQGKVIHVHLVEEGVAVPTGKRFTMEIVHAWVLDEAGRIASFREYNDTYAMRAAFDPEADSSLSLVANPADYGIPTSSYTDTLQAGLAFYAAFGRADFDYFIANTDPELVLILAGPPSITPFARTFYGIEGITDFLVRVFTAERFIELQFKSFTVDGSRLDAEFREVVSVYATGKTFICEGLHTFIASDEGKLRSFRSYNDTYSVAMGFTP